MDRAQTEARIKELRGRAKRLRESAQHADSRAAYAEDMQASARYEDEADELQAELNAQSTFDLVAHLYDQREFSINTFGTGARTKGVLDHIRKELTEIEQSPSDLEEWIDVVMLALDGAWRAGFDPIQIASALGEKLAKNKDRSWPDWRTADKDCAIEHIRHG